LRQNSVKLKDMIARLCARCIALAKVDFAAVGGD